MNNFKEMIELSVILPCRNEEKTLGDCIKTIKRMLAENNITGEIIVSDSSEDNSPQIAKKSDVILVKHDKPGYGRAYLEGFKRAVGRYVFCADADGTYDFNEIPRFLNELKNGNEFVIGNRFKGKIVKGAMPWLHQYIGSPILSFIFRLFFHGKIGDINCGMRAIKKELLPKLNLQTTGMEFASEMVIKAVKNNLKIKELAINYYPRLGSSKLRTFSDGWKHLRFMLLYSPMFLFFIPGLLLSSIGLISMFWLYFGQPVILGIPLFFHPLFLSSVLIIVGYQLIIFSVFAKTYAITHLGEDAKFFNVLYRLITIEKAIFLGGAVGLMGIIIFFLIFYKWIKSGFGALEEVKSSILALTLISVGIQTASSAFMLSILGIKEK